MFCILVTHASTSNVVPQCSITFDSYFTCTCWRGCNRYYDSFSHVRTLDWPVMASFNQAKTTTRIMVIFVEIRVVSIDVPIDLNLVTVIIYS